jgi:hypothetical protein
VEPAEAHFDAGWSASCSGLMLNYGGQAGIRARWGHTRRISRQSLASTFATKEKVRLRTVPICTDTERRRAQTRSRLTQSLRLPGHRLRTCTQRDEVGHVCGPSVR